MILIHVALGRWKNLPRILAALVSVASGAACAGPEMSVPQSADTHAVAEKIYREGILADGSPLVGTGAGGVILRAGQAACANCHRRSGMGSAEGGKRVSPITGQTLFAPGVHVRPSRPDRKSAEVVAPRHASRAAYDDVSLKRALQSGVDASGRPLDALMPRYRLAEPDMQALVAYLRGLSTAPPPGVDGDGLHVATVIVPGVEAARRETMLEVLRAWAATHKGLHVHVWELGGAPEAWEAELEARLRERSVFAMLSGMGTTEWAPVERFCERHTLPCLFPDLDFVPAGGNGYYTMYFHSGVTLEAGMLARIVVGESATPARVVQVEADAAGAAAAATFAAAVAESAIRTETHHWSGAARADAPADPGPEDMVVAWLRPAALERWIDALPAHALPARVYLSAQLAPPESVNLPEAWRRRTAWLSAYAHPALRRGRAALALTPWLQRVGVPPGDERLQSDTYAAAFFFTDALARMQGHVNQEYLLETLERAVDSRPAAASFYTLSLGPGQRFAAKGGRLLGYAPPAYDRLTTLGPRIVP